MSAQWLVRGSLTSIPTARHSMLVHVVHATPWCAADDPPADGGPWLLITDPLAPAALRAFAHDATQRGIASALAVEPMPPTLGEATTEQPVALRVLAMPPTTDPSLPPHRRTVLDVALALTLGLALLPALVLAVAAVALESPGSPIFTQDRVGQHGRLFRLWKIRSMARTAEPYAQSPDDHDPRVTRIGRVLRSTGLDEVPQLLNVLRGEMRLTGPRPEMPFIADTYTEVQRERLGAPPGLTGLWQLEGDRSRAMHQQPGLDLYYLAFRTLALDVQLLADTVRYAARGLARALARRADV